MKIQVINRFPNRKKYCNVLSVSMPGYDITIVPLSETRAYIHMHTHVGRYLKEQRSASILAKAFVCLEMAPPII